MNKQALTIEELAAEVSRLLAAHGLSAQPDGRVSSSADLRTVRYYATLGLVDRPRIVDREARYGRRHVLQFAAVKALQAASCSLAEIQERLYGRSEAELQAILVSMRREPDLRPIVWREVTLEPGLKVFVEQGWTSRSDPSALEEKIRAAVAALMKGAPS